MKKPALILLLCFCSSGEIVYESILLSCLPEHPNLLRLFAIGTTRQEIDGKERRVMVVEAHENGSLKEYIQFRKGTAICGEYMTIRREKSGFL